MIRAVIFDFDGVVATRGYWLWLKDNIANLQNTSDYFLDICNKENRGDISEQQFVSILAEKSGKAKEQIWPEIFKKTKINKKMLELIKTLRQNYKIGLLTNFVSEWILEILDTYKLHDYFSKIIISAQEKVIKPDSKIYYKMVQSLGIRPQEAIFIDDKQSNVDGATNVGIKGILYVTYEQLKKDLQYQGVKV